MSSWVRHPSVARLRAVVFALPWLAAPLAAQVDPDSVKLRNDCRLAEQVLTTGQPAPHRQQALRVIGLCGRTAAPAIAAAWMSTDANRSDLGLLVTATRAIITAPLVESLFSTLQSGRPTDIRLASLLVLITYADPFVIPGFDSFVGDATEPVATRYGRVDHPLPAAGRESVEPPTPRLRTTLEAIAAADPDGEMRRVARIALQNPPFK